MSQTTHHHLEKIFNDVLDMDRVKRASYLKDLMQRDPAMAEELKGMLDEYEQFLDEPLCPGLADLLKNSDWEGESEAHTNSDDEEPPTKVSMLEQTTVPGSGTFGKVGEKLPESIGPYRVIRKIGEGGMGLVYLVQQQKPSREVALKLLHRHRTTHELRARFAAEHGVLAMMSHNNIARIYEVGNTEMGDTWFTMEYVDGQPITDFCHERGLSIRERLILFRQVCDGVLHAHQKAIVHRDLKPSNILVTMAHDRPVVKIIDFGIAKGLENSLLERPFETRTGMLVGTLEYMSPEQLKSGGESADTRSDIHAMGVVLYQMLTGMSPLERPDQKSTSPEDILGFYRLAEPVKPSSRLKNTDILEDTQATHGFTDPDRVYSQIRGDLDRVVMKAMAKDVERRYSSAAVLKEDIDNFLDNRPVTARKPTTWYLLRRFVKRNKYLVGSATSVFLALVIGLALAVNSSVKERQTRQQMEITLKRLETTNTFLQNMLSAADPRLSGVETKVIDVLDNAEMMLEQPNLDKEQEAMIRIILGETFTGLSLQERASGHYNKAYGILRETLGDRDPSTLRVRYFLGRSFQKLKKFELSKVHMEETYRLQVELLGEEHPQTLETLYDKGTLYRKMKDKQQALKCYRLAYKGQSEVLGPQHPDTVRTLHEIALYLNDDHEKKEKYFQEVIKVQKEQLGPLHPETQMTMFNYGRYLRQTENPKSCSLLREVYEGRMQTMGPDHNLTKRALKELGYSLFSGNRWDQAREAFSKLFNLYLKSNGLDHRRTLETLNDLAISWAEAGFVTEAIELFKDVENYATFNNWPGLAQQAMNNRGNYFIQTGQFKEAQEILEISLEKRLAKYGPTNIRSFNGMVSLGELYQKMGSYPEANTLLCIAYEACVVHHPNSAQIPAYRARYADSLIDSGHLNRAEALLSGGKGTPEIEKVIQKLALFRK